MNLKQLQIFKTVAELESMTKASKVLFLAQPAISLAISQLEKEYQIQLFLRTNQRIYLTDQGKEFLNYVQNIINDIDQLNDFAFGMSQKSLIRMGCSLSVSENILPKVLKKCAFLSQYQIHYLFSISSEIIQQIDRNHLDFGIIETPFFDSKYQIMKLFDDQLEVISSLDYPIDSSITTKDLLHYPTLLRNEQSGTRKSLDLLLKSKGITLKPICTSSSNQALIEMAKNGLGIAIVSNSSLSSNENQIKKIFLKDNDMRRSISLVYKKSKNISSSTTRLIQYLEKSLKEEMK